MLVDTSVWMEHLRSSDPVLVGLLEEGWVETHPFVVGELTLGGLDPAGEFLDLLGALPLVPTAGHDEVLHLVREHRLAGTGIGWVDAHLLAAALIGGTGLWTHDRRLLAVAQGCGVAR